MASPLEEPLLTVPYVGVAEFRASPTWVDTDDLIQAGNQAAQDAELYNVLLKASGWAWSICEQPLHAHMVTQNLRCRVNKYGQVFIHPDNTPIRYPTGIAFGPDPKLMSVLADLTGVWIENARGLVVSLIPNGGLNLGSLQFGSVPPPVMETYVTIQYVAGYGNTYLTAPATATQTTLTVADPTGFVAPQTSLFGNQVGGSIARIWEPGLEEAVKVDQTYVAGASPLKLASALASNHAAGVQVSEFPPEVRQAVIALAVALLVRDDASKKAPFPGSPGPTARRAAGKGQAGGMIEEAERLLGPFRRTR